MEKNKENNVLRLVVERDLEDKNSIKISKTSRGYSFEIKCYGEDLKKCRDEVLKARKLVVKDIEAWNKDEGIEG